MPPRLKVYGGQLTLPGGQRRVFVAASSREGAATAITTATRMAVTLGYLRDFFSVSGNKLELELALANPGRVFAYGPGAYAHPSTITGVRP